MPATFPLSMAEFIDALPVKSVNFAPIHNNEMSRTRDGQFITAYNGPTLWKGAVVLGRVYNEDAAEVRALLSLAQQYDASFIMRHPGYKGPRKQAGVNTGKLAATPINMRDIQITGLPPAYVLSAGDLVGWQYGSAPVRYAFHTVVFTRTASAGGTILVEVQPMLKPGSLVAGAAVDLIAPRMRAKVIPGTVNIGADAAYISDGSSFEFQQIIGE